MSDILVTIAGIKGDSLDAFHPGAIEAHAWHWKVQQSPGALCTPDGRGQRGAVSDLVFTHAVDRASPNLAAYCWKGQ
jgi:type VI secretion system secreted protein Hcp